MSQKLKCKVQAYNMRVRVHRNRTFENADAFFYTLRDISNFTYTSMNPQQNIRRKIGEFDYAMEFINFPADKNENLTRIDFKFGRETRESFSLKHKNGQASVLQLPDDSNICFDTHGSFILRKIRNEWCCVLLLEKRHHTTTGLSKIIEYIEKVRQQYSIEADAIAHQADVIRKIKKTTNVNAAIIRNQKLDLETNDGSGTIFVKNRERKKYEATKVHIRLFEGNTTWERFVNFAKDYLNIDREPTNQEVIQLIDATQLVLLRKTSVGSDEPKQIDLFKDLVLFRMEVQQRESRELDSQNFFDKLFNVVQGGTMDSIFELSRKFYD